jgi:hypothetical protein
MAISANFTRPLTAVTESETSNQTIAVHEAAGSTYADNTATVNSQLRLLDRFKLTIETAGQSQRFKIEYLDFSSSTDETFTAGDVTTPFTDAEADSVTLIGYSPWVDRHAQYVTAGDTTAS